MKEEKYNTIMNRLDSIIKMLELESYEPLCMCGDDEKKEKWYCPAHGYSVKTKWV